MDNYLPIRNLRQIVSNVVYERETFRNKATSIANNLNLPLVHADFNFALESHDQYLYKYYLHFGNLGLSLRPHGAFTHGPIYCDFNSNKILYRRKYGGGNGQALAKAIGVTDKCKPRVLDLTAGLGTDSFILASLGCEILMLERNPVVYELLCDGLARASKSASHDKVLSSIVNRLSLTKTDAHDYFAKLLPQCEFDVIYLDPMFALPSRAAKAKKEMYALQSIVGADTDASKLLEKAMRHVRYRTVVKRSNKSLNLGHINPNIVLRGRSTRYDIYTNCKLPLTL